jgi:hypothetical protein
VDGGVGSGPNDKDERRRWLEELAAACERVLLRDSAATVDRHHAALREDVAALLAQIRVELASLNG